MSQVFRQAITDRRKILVEQRLFQLRQCRELLPVKEFEPVHPQHGPASPTPVSDGERVFAVFGSFGIIAYDLEGNEIWRIARDTRRNMFGSASSPIVVDEKLIVFTGAEDESLALGVAWIKTSVFATLSARSSR